MENPATIDTYGGQMANTEPVEDPTTQQDASDHNQMINDVAQMTRTSAKIILHFPTVASGNSTPTQTSTQWGSGASKFPTTVTRTGTGTYEITYPATFGNELGNDETVSFWTATGSVQSTSVFGRVQAAASGAVITLTVINDAGVAVDLTVGTIIRVEAA